MVICEVGKKKIIRNQLFWLLKLKKRLGGFCTFSVIFDDLMIFDDFGELVCGLWMSIMVVVGLHMIIG